MKDKKNDFKIGGKELLPLLPLRDIVIFPGMMVPLFVGRDKSINAVEYALDNGSIIMLSTQKSAKKEDPDKNDIHTTGCVSEIMQVFKMPDGTVKIMVEGLERAEITSIRADEKMLMAEVKDKAQAKSNPSKIELEALSRSLKDNFGKMVRADSNIPLSTETDVLETSHPEDLGDLIMSHISLDTNKRQEVLAEPDLKKRLEKILGHLESEIEILQIERKVKGRVKKQMDKSQREYYLNEQMKAIHKELGRSDTKSEIQELSDKVKKANMPADIETKALKELGKLEQMPPMSAEGTVVRNYLDWLLDVPWSKRSRDILNTKRAKKVLDDDHHGLEEVKERILDYLAVRKLSGSGRGPILCLVGPPGVGKTSLGKSVARAMGRKFVRLSLGGIRDEAEIRGHRRTYIGALPGRIIQSMKKAGTVNPVVMLDEIDKMSMDFRGDPSSALLEVLDPEQNKNFSDHYLEVDYDLSEVLFITTANMRDRIPMPLLDRMEVLRMSGYTEYDKLKIAANFLVPKQLKEHGLKKKDLVFSDQVISTIMRHYTREAGVRNLERVTAKICRKIVRSVVEKKKYSRILKSSDIKKLLGPEKFRVEMAQAHKETGFAIGMAWTETGGEIMNVEVSVVPGTGKLTLTGKLGDVMRESAQAALTYIRSRAHRFSLKSNFYSKSDIHIHVPEGAIPKDGPSAGITMASAMVSAFCKVPVRHNVSMTGEITLRGKVLPIGGLKEKVLAAHRAGIRKVVFPAENSRDLEEIPKIIRKDIDFSPVESMDDVLKTVMTEPVFKRKPGKVRAKKKPASPRVSEQPRIN